MRKVKAPKPEPVVRIETYKIHAKYAEDIFFPSNAVEDAFWHRPFDVPMNRVRFITSDGKTCKPTFISTTNNRNGEYDERFDDFCQRMFGMTYKRLRSVWIARLGTLDYYWHWVKLVEE